MTMPHLMNCDHSEDGWCLDCVKRLHDESEKTRSDWLDAMAIVNAAEEFKAGRISTSAFWRQVEVWQGKIIET